MRIPLINSKFLCRSHAIIWFFVILTPLSLSILTKCPYFISFSTSSLPPLLRLPLCILIFSLWVHYLPLRSVFLKWVMVTMLMRTIISTAKNVGSCSIFSEEWEYHKWKYTWSWFPTYVELYLFLSLEVSISYIIKTHIFLFGKK